MRRTITMLVALAALAIAGCTTMTPGQRQLTGTVIGGTAGLLTASALNASAGWTVVTVLAGAAVGTLVARNASTGECAYAVGGGRYETRPCP